MILDPAKLAMSVYHHRHLPLPLSLVGSPLIRAHHLWQEWTQSKYPLSEQTQRGKLHYLTPEFHFIPLMSLSALLLEQCPLVVSEAIAEGPGFIPKVVTPSSL